MPTESEPVRVIEGDSLEVLRSLPDRCVDAIVTDPPYPREFWPVVSAIVPDMARVLKDRGELVMLVGHHMLSDALGWLEGAGLRYWWTCGMRHHHRVKLFGKRVNSYWKPALWFIKGKKRRLHDMPSDLVLGNKPQKLTHKWEQGEIWFRHWVDRICNPGETVLDPFAGTGTTAVSCVSQNRKCILIEKDSAHCQTARGRVADAMGNGKGSILAEDLFTDLET